MYKRFATDTNAEKDGVWIDFGEGIEVKIARFGNPHHQDVLDRLRRPYRDRLRRGKDLPKDVQEDITIRSMAEAIVLDWRGEGVVDENGEPLTYNRENCIKVLQELPDFRNECASVALEHETYRAESLRIAEKNSKSASDGKSPGGATKTR